MTAWSQAPERGASWLVRLMLWLMRHIGWFARLVVLPGISLWFFATSAAARRASRHYLAAVRGHPTPMRDVLRHIHVFASTILDRAALLTGTGHDIALDVAGLEHLEARVAEGGGCLLLGAHLGSFAILRNLAQTCPVPVKMLMYRANAGAYSTTMARLDPAASDDVIPIGDVQSMLRVHEAVAGGAVIGILADRIPPGGQTMAVPFLGRPAPFPTGPFILAASLGAPVMLFHAVRTGRRRYAVRFTPFARRIELPRATRQAALHEVIAGYARWLEASCRAHPFNWFNFYAFWERAEHGSTRARPLVAAPADAVRPVLGPGAAAG